jgi:hypothetical protein
MNIKSDAEVIEKEVETQYIPFSYAVMKSFRNKPFWQGSNAFNIVFNTGVAVFLNANVFTVIAIALGFIAFMINVGLEYNFDKKPKKTKIKTTIKESFNHNVDWEHPMDKVYT